MTHPQNKRVIQIECIQVDDEIGLDRIKLIDSFYGEYTHIERKYHNCVSVHGSVIDQTLEFLKNCGFTVLFYGQVMGGYVVVVDNWGLTLPAAAEL